MSIEGVLSQGFVTTQVDKLVNWTRTGSLWPAMLAHVVHNLLVTGLMLPVMWGIDTAPLA